MFEERKSRTAWLAGARAFHAGDLIQATHQFERAISFDPGMADAWLGLHATGVQQQDAVTAMATNIERFGQERRRNNLGLDSQFVLGPYVIHSLRTDNDLWCAVAASQIENNELDQAAQTLEHITSDHAPARFVRGWLGFVAGDREDAISQLRSVMGHDRFLEASARLMSGILLAEAGAMEPAKDHLNWLIHQQFLPELHAETLYFLGLIARAQEDEEAAVQYFHRAYAIQPHFSGLKEAMESDAPAARIELARSRAAADKTSSEPDQDDSPVSAETVEDVLADLDKQIGQEGIKQQVRTLLAQTRAQIVRHDMGIQQARMTEHFVFTGPPGTGKTTIARLVGRLYKALGILQHGSVVEVSRSDLIGQYHGHTVARTQEKIDEAIGGVLFIDEAYTLQTDGFAHGDPFGQEAVDTLLKRMEDDRARLVVIAAGYPEPMEQFLDSNPGLRSRFTTTIDFTPYRVAELIQIADIMALDTGNALTDEGRTALGLILDVIDAEGGLNNPTFGNARFVRNIVEKAARARDLRLFSEVDTEQPSLGALTELTAEDINAAAQTAR